MSEAFEKGFLEARLTERQADRVWEVMQLAECTPEEALTYLLDIAGGELASGDWDGSTAREAGVQGVQVSRTNLHLLSRFKVGDMVITRDEAGTVLVGQIQALSQDWAKLALTKGSIRRRKGDPGLGDFYTASAGSLQEL